MSGGHASHFKNECMHGLVLGQCRCPALDKVIHLVECPLMDPQHQELVSNLMDKAIEDLEDPVKASQGEPDALAFSRRKSGIIMRLKAVQSDLSAARSQLDRIIEDLEALT